MYNSDQNTNPSGPSLPSNKKLWAVSTLVIFAAVGVFIGLYKLEAFLFPDAVEGALFVAAYVITFGGYWLLCRKVLAPRGYYSVPWGYSYYDTDVTLNNNTVNGIGTVNQGEFGRHNDFFRSYQFFCFLYIPVVPMDCIVKSDNVATEDGGTCFRVAGRSKWHPLEVTFLMGRIWFFIGCGFLIMWLFI